MMFKQAIASLMGMAACGVGFTGAAEAAMFKQAESTWINPAPIDNVNQINVDIGGFNSITWGNLLPSGLGFKSEENVSFEFRDTFQVGTLAFLNTLDGDNSVLESVDLDLDLEFVDPIFGTAAAVFNLDIISRRLLQPDSVEISPNPLLNTTFLGSNGRKYQVDLRFTPDSLTANELSLKTAALKARVTQVPEPASTLALAAIAGMVATGILKKKQAV